MSANDELLQLLKTYGVDATKLNANELKIIQDIALKYEVRTPSITTTTVGDLSGINLTKLADGEISVTPIVGPPTPASGKLITGSTADFSRFPLENKGILGNLDKDGIVEFKINTEGSGIRGTDLFKQMMEHFGGHAKGVKGKWVSGTNLDKVNELTANGVPLEVAITKTWTANRARDAGFGNATLVKPATGLPGAYTDIEVVFTK